jgi:oligopeptidase B
VGDDLRPTFGNLVSGHLAQLEHAAMLVPGRRPAAPVSVPSMVSPEPTTSPAAPPVAVRRPVTSEHHGRTRTDEYDWLRDADSPEVRAHLEAENDWTAASTAHLADLRERLYEEIRVRTKETDLSVPTRNRGWW